MITCINKPFSDKTTFFLLTNYNDPNLYQFHLPFLSLIKYPLKMCLQCTFSIKKGYQQYCGHGYGRKLLHALLRKSTKLWNSFFKIWSLFICLQKVGFKTLDKFIEGDRVFIAENDHILYNVMYIYIILFVLAEKVFLSHRVMLFLNKTSANVILSLIFLCSDCS